MAADVTVVGAGIIALMTAIELAERGVTVQLAGTTHRGEASSAAAGMLVPGIEPELAPVRAFAIASRERYPSYLANLEAHTKIHVPLNRLGALRIAVSEAHAAELAEQIEPDNIWLDQREIAELEPALAHAFGAALTPHDGCVDPLPLLDALRALIAQYSQAESHKTRARITVTSENVCTVEMSRSGATVITDGETRLTSQHVVLAAGAWTPKIERLIENVDHNATAPIPLPIEPIRGQIIAYRGTPIRHVTNGQRGYLVPKADGHTLAGSTLENVGFTSETTEDGLAAVHALAEAISPAVAQAPISATWAGLRPVTPDLLPIIGPDPSAPHLIYACGHSRNGILLAPLTAEVVADLVTGTAASRYTIDQFRPGRF